MCPPNGKVWHRWLAHRTSDEEHNQHNNHRNRRGKRYETDHSELGRGVCTIRNTNYKIEAQHPVMQKAFMSAYLMTCISMKRRSHSALVAEKQWRIGLAKTLEGGCRHTIGKRLAWPQQPNLYLEPKWLRWQWWLRQCTWTRKADRPQRRKLQPWSQIAKAHSTRRASREVPHDLLTISRICLVLLWFSLDFIDLLTIDGICELLLSHFAIMFLKNHIFARSENTHLIKVLRYIIIYLHTIIMLSNFAIIFLENHIFARSKDTHLIKVVKYIMIYLRNMIMLFDFAIRFLKKHVFARSKDTHTVAIALQ